MAYPNEPEPNPIAPLPGGVEALATMLSNLPGAAYECSLDAPWTMIYLSAGVQALTGYPPQIFTNGELAWGDITHPDDLPPLQSIVDEAIRAGRQFSASYRIRCASGEDKWVLERGEAVYSPSGAPTTIVGFIGDITHQKHMEQRREESKNHYKSAMELNKHFPWAADAQGAVVEMSNKFLEYVGLPRDQAVGDGWLQAVHPDDVDPTVEYCSAAISSGTPIDLRFRIRNVSGEYRWCRARGAPRKNTDGAVVRWHGTSEDIDRQVKAEIKFAGAQVELMHVSQAMAMSVMAATIAHELNQPLAAASNYLTASSRLVGAHLGPGSTEIEHGLNETAQQIHRAGEIIRRMRALVRHDQSKRKLVSIEVMVRRVAILLEASGTCQGPDLTISIRRGAGKIAVDQIQIEQVLLNLLRNACNAMSHLTSPAIEVAAEREGASAVKVTIKDVGKGLSNEIKDQLFTAYGHSSSEGLGVGLSISRTIVEAHGGRIWAENNPDVGASFMFTVPLALSASCRTKEERHS